jgi:hypothetical protein
VANRRHALPTGQQASSFSPAADREKGGRTIARAVTDHLLGLKNTLDATQRGTAKGEKYQRRAVSSRRAHPQNPIERFIERTYDGGGE